MEILGVLFRQVIIMFILMGVGFAAYRKDWISDQGAKDIGKLLLNVAIPVVVVSNFCVQKSAEKTMELFSSLFFSVLSLLIAILVSFVLFHKKDRIAEFASAFSNAGFIGIPLVQATFGSTAVFYISMMIVLISFLQWTYGVYTITDDKSVMDVKKVLGNPVFLAVLIGLFLYFTQISLPSLASEVFSIISSINTPLAMFSSGVYLAQSDLSLMIRNRNMYFVSLMRLLIIPLITVAAFKLIPFGTEAMKLSILCAAACPVGSNVAIFAQQYDKDYRSGVGYVCISTLLCIITLPLLVYIAGLIL